jgi:hypothetical protein
MATNETRSLNGGLTAGSTDGKYPNIGPKVKDRASIAYTDTPARKNDSYFVPGSTNKGNK